MQSEGGIVRMKKKKKMKFCITCVRGANSSPIGRDLNILWIVRPLSSHSSFTESRQWVGALRGRISQWILQKKVRSSKQRFCLGNWISASQLCFNPRACGVKSTAVCWVPGPGRRDRWEWREPGLSKDLDAGSVSWLLLARLILTSTAGGVEYA